MSFDQELMRLARGALDGVLSGLTKQLNVVGDQALNPMQAIIQQVVGGVWTGNGANAFVKEVSSLLIPGVSQIMSLISSMSGNLQKACGTMDLADQNVGRKVQDVASTFDFYR